MVARMQVLVARETRFKFSKVYYIIDSQIVLAMLQRDSYIFHTFVGSRVNEIQTITELSRWFWVEGTINVADYVTRPRDPVEIGCNSIWQKGQKFLEKPVEEWPIKQDCNVLEIPERIRKVMKTKVVVLHVAPLCPIDIERFPNFKRLVRTTARLLSMCLNVIPTHP